MNAFCSVSKNSRHVDSEAMASSRSAHKEYMDYLQGMSGSESSEREREQNRDRAEKANKEQQENINKIHKESMYTQRLIVVVCGAAALAYLYQRRL